MIIFAAAIVLGSLMYRYIEVPLKARQTHRAPESSNKANAIVVAVTAGTLAVAGTGATVVLNQPQNQVVSVFEDWDWQNYPGALSTTNNYGDVPDVDSFLPEVSELTNDRPALYEEGCIQKGGNGPEKDEILVCDDPDRPSDPTATVALSGGSHSMHWHEAWKALADEYDWELLVVNKDACVFMDTTHPDSAACNGWNENYIDWLQSNDVDLVVANGTRIFSESPEKIRQGAPERWQQITDTGAELLLMRGTPRPGDDVDDCLASDKSPTECGADTTQIAEVNPFDSEDLPEGTSTVDLLPNVCPKGMNTDSDQCPAVVGNVVVWYDGSHLTNHYVATLTPILEGKLREEKPWLFD